MRRAHRTIASHCLKAALVEASELRFGRARRLLAEAQRRAPNGEAANPVKSAIDKLEAGVRDSALTSSNAAMTTEARFRLSLLSGRRPDTLEAAERLLQDSRG